MGEPEKAKPSAMRHRGRDTFLVVFPIDGCVTERSLPIDCCECSMQCTTRAIRQMLSRQRGLMSSGDDGVSPGEEAEGDVEESVVDKSGGGLPV